MIFSAQKDIALARPVSEAESAKHQQELNQKIMNSPGFSQYSLYWENQNIAVYQRTPPSN
jgi:hypothetical protein